MPRKTTVEPEDENADRITRERRAALGAFLRARREELGLRVSDLAANTELSASYISALEIGRIGLPALERRKVIANALGVRNVDLMLAAGEIEPDEVATRLGEYPAYTRHAQLHRAIEAMPESAAAALQDLILFIAQSPVIAEPLTESATRARWLTEMQRIRNQAVHGRTDDDDDA